ncbi:DUF1549 domain-containing protein [Verrucomicrobiales bacterium BCK34]|nr:DUF1549 domain-containing protein [Verrucomicrobiales bacterium BCK34]
MKHFLPTAILASQAFLCFDAQGEIDFVHEVVPILKQHCTECHGGEEAEGGFSVNTRELFLDDDSAEPGNAENSYFIELILDKDPDYQMPPIKKKRMPKEQVETLKQWVNEGMNWEPGFTFGKPTYDPPLEPRMPEIPKSADGRDNPVDRFIDHYLATNKLPRPGPIDDLTFLRRAHLDLIGLLPTAEEAEAFVGNKSPQKRTEKIDELLNREISYTDHWLTFWNDLLRNDYAGTGFITKGRTQISGWLYDALKTNQRFDTMVRELIAPPTGESAGFINGIKWRGTVSVSQTLPVQFSQSISQSFLGINMKCASCHDSFIDRWKLTDAYGLAAIYAEEPLEIHRCDKPVGETAKAAWVFPEIGNIDPEASKEARLTRLADLMTHPENGRVPRTIVNRLWAQLMGRGLVHPLDAMQTEPWHEDLLDFLGSTFQENGYDLKDTIRLIATSEAYQSRAEPRKSEESGKYTYRGPLAKRLTSEQFIDAIWQLSEAAPTSFDAPVVRGIANEKDVKKLQIPSRWIWKASAATPPAAGDEALLRKDFTIKKRVIGAGLVASADNSFTLQVNRKEALSGSNWSELESASVINLLRPGVNRILLLAKNGGDKPNAAGAFAMLRLVYEDGSDEIITTDETWQAATTIPKNFASPKWDFSALKWTSVSEMKADVWPAAIDQLIGEALAIKSAAADLMVRASLLKSDFLMRSLGRPNRDQIVTSRPNEITTLEAIDLSNSETLAGYLDRGAERFLESASAPDFIDQLYLAALTRKPGDGERALLAEILTDTPDHETIADVLWAITMTPEFMLIR